MKSNMNFNIENFILQVQNHPVLWDNNHPESTQRNSKQAAWENVAARIYQDWGDLSNYDKFGKVKDMQNKWKSIRDEYSKELKYQKKLEQGFTPAKKDRYKYAHLLTFLDDQVKRKNKGSDQSGTDLDDSGETKDEKEMENLKLSKVKERTTNGSLSRKTNENSNKRAKRLKLSHSNNSVTMDFMKNESDTSTVDSDTNVETVHKIFKRTKQNNNASKKTEQSVTCSSELKHNNQENSQELSTLGESSDSNAKMFFMSLVPYFKEFNEEQQLRAKMEISRIMHKIYCEKL